MTVAIKKYMLRVFISILLILAITDSVKAWNSGGTSGDPDNPEYGTHDFILKKAISMLPNEMQNKIDLNAAMYGSEIPGCKTGTDCIGDDKKHHVYYRDDGRLQNDDSALRAQQEYDLANSYLQLEDKYNFSIHLGAMSHYISDVAVFGNTMGTGTDWDPEDHYKDYETYVEENLEFFNNYVSFDGRLESMSAYNATLKLANETTFDSGIYTNMWMDSNYNWSDPDYLSRTGNLLNYGVNLLADVVYGMDVPIITPTSTITSSPTSTVTPSPTSTITSSPTSTVTPSPTSTITSSPTSMVSSITDFSDGKSSDSNSSEGRRGTSDENYSNIELKENYDRFIFKDKVTPYRFINESNPILFVNISGNKSIGKISTTVELLRNTSSLVKTPAPGIIYKNVNIWVDPYILSVPNNIKEVIIKFKIDNVWLNNNHLAERDIKMLQWNGSNWLQLETMIKEKDMANTYFEARTHNFSHFVLAGIKNGGDSEKGTATMEVSDLILPENNTIADVPKNIPGFETIMAGILLLAICIFRRKGSI